MNPPVLQGIISRLRGHNAKRRFSACSSLPQRVIRLTTGSTFFLLFSAVASAQAASNAQPVAVINAPLVVPAEPGVNSLVVELRDHVEKKSVQELRATYSGPYAASLLFKPDDLQFYVALFQQEKLWRALKTADYAEAERLYRSYATQAEDLAKVDIQRTYLDAVRVYTEQRIEREVAELAAISNSLVYQQQRERDVVIAQEQAREEATALAAKEQAAKQRLAELQQSIRVLASQQDALLRADVTVKRGQ